MRTDPTDGAAMRYALHPPADAMQPVMTSTSGSWQHVGGPDPGREHAWAGRGS
ncbi:hypothetical protein ACFH04_05780 [Streptomyces noboritoensis]|uniref:Uncharacterized protein n=1 Tax=Streptomyces noboritoensis TaxID=67337 RepID=A0ABV6TFI6_9ACTN